MDRSCMVVGAGGFIGYNLCLELHGKYQKIYACDNFFPETILDRFQQLNIEIIEGGVEGFVISQKKYKHIEDIFYFAGNSVPALVETELERGSFSDQEFLVMMLSSLKDQVKKVRFIYGSSGGTVYGRTANVACEETMICQPISAYGLSKYIQEQYIHFFAKKIGFDYFIARISNPYGRILTHGSKNLQGFIDNVVKKVLRNKEIEIWGDGSVIRDFIHIKDLVIALRILTSKNIPSGIYNIGSGQATSLNDVISSIESLGRQMNVTRLESRKIDLEVNVLSVEKIHQTTGWTPKITLQAGLKDLLNPD